MNTLADIKRLLDEGETLTDGYRTMWKAPFPNQYTINHNLSTVTLDWDDILYLVVPDPSLWRQRDQIGAEKPVMMEVPIEQWDALQEELTELRRFKQENTGSVWVGEPIGKVKPEPEYEYEMFFKSEPTDSCKIDGWYPIATDRIRNPDKIDQYIQNGLLRKLTNENTNN